MYIVVYVFVEGLWHNCSANQGLIFTSFGAVLASTNKTKVPERRKKSAPKTELRAGEKVTQAGPSGVEKRGGGPETIQRTPQFTPLGRSRTPYEHSKGA
jgi:hypothetical protein